MPTDLCLAHLVRRDWLTDGPLNELLALYIQALQNRRYARSTLSAYLRCLAHFSYWMRGEGLSVADIDRALIEPSSSASCCITCRRAPAQRLADPM